MRTLDGRGCVSSVRAILERVIGLWAGGPAPYAAAVPVPASVRGRAPATVSAPARGHLRLGARPYLVRRRGTPFQMKQIIPFRLHIDRAKWDFLLHLEYRDGERVRSCGRVTKKVPTEVETLNVTSGGDEGNPRTAAPSASASARVRASRAAPENARAFPRLRAPNGVRSHGRVTKKVPTGVETSDVTSGGGEGNRTPDLLTASQALSQLSYAPKQQKRTIRECI